eukprot:g3193.t1
MDLHYDDILEKHQGSTVVHERYPELSVEEAWRRSDREFLRNSGVSELELFELENTYAYFDPEVKGYIDMHNIAKLYERNGLRYSSRDLQIIFNRIARKGGNDEHDTKRLFFREFAVCAHNEMVSSDAPFVAFFDTVMKKTKNGVVDPLSLRQTMRKLGEKISTGEARDMLHVAHSHKDIIEHCSQERMKKIIPVDKTSRRATPEEAATLIESIFRGKKVRKASRRAKRLLQKAQRFAFLKRGKTLKNSHFP